MISLQAGTLSTPGLTVTASGQVYGSGTVAGPIQNNGLVQAGPMTLADVTATNAQTLVLSGAVSGTGTLLVGPYLDGTSSTLELAGSDTQTVQFGDGHGHAGPRQPGGIRGRHRGRAPPPPSVCRAITAFPATTSFVNDTVILAGIAMASVTGTSFAATAGGGTLTVQEGSAQQVLSFVGSNVTAASFALSAGPQALSTSPPSLRIVVTPTPSTPVVTVAGGGRQGDRQRPRRPPFPSPRAPMPTVSLSANGVAQGTGTVAYPIGLSNAETYAATLSPGLGLGFQTIVAAATNSAGTTVSAPLSLDVLPAPVNGVTTAASTSLDLANVLGQGYGFQFVGGTEALQLTNGTLSIGPDTTQALVQRLYEGLLGRGGDTFGLGGFNAMLVGGGSPATVATSILNSGEYQALHGAPASQTDTQYVTSLYQSFLSRAPDQAGLAGFVNVLSQGTSRGEVAANVAQSAEAKADLAGATAHLWVPDPQGALVTELYESGLGRAPDLASLQAWKQQLSAGLTPLQLSQAIATSAEFNADHAGSSSAAFVTSLYQAGLGRAPGAAELQGWVGQLQAGAGSTNVLYGIATSAEAGVHLLPPI